MKVALLTVAIMAASSVGAAELNKSQISKKFQSVVPFTVIDIEESPITGFYQVLTKSGIYYASKDGKHILSGSVHDFEAGLKNHTAIRQQKINEVEIARQKDKYVTFKAPNEKHEILVFFDTSCGYCQKLHSEIAAFNAKGITVHYAAWPRQGVRIQNSTSFTPNYLEMESIWCAENPAMMLNLAERGGAIPPKTCKASGVEEQYSLGTSLGIRGTPAIFNLKGQEVIPGYAPADRILQRLAEMGS